MTAPWQCPPVHPAAEKLPLMSDAEIDELAKDIEKNGLLEPIIIWVDNRKEANGAKRGLCGVVLLHQKLVTMKPVGVPHALIGRCSFFRSF
jgi:hypothetical protein